MLRKIRARIFLGGRIEGYKGTMPGIAEEAKLSLEAGQPVYFLGGFGGCTRDIAETIGVAKRWIGSRDEMWPGRECFQGYSRADMNNGLTSEESSILALTSHIQVAVTLVLRGLRRISESGEQDAQGVH